MTAVVTTKILTGFADAAIGPELWSQLLEQGDTNAVNLTCQWQRNWWETFGRGKLLLIAAERAGQIVAIAPLFADGGMIFNICPEDHLDFVGDVSDPEVLDSILSTARSALPDFLGFRFYFFPDSSHSGQRLQESAARLNLVCYEDEAIPSPLMDLSRNPELAHAATRKKSLVRHERFFTREGNLQVRHYRTAADILPQLPEFFEQHVARRAATPHPSLYCQPIQRAYYERLTRAVAPTGWLRFTRVEWNGRPIAFHYGACYRGRFVFGIPSFDIALARHSPGEVLLRQLLIAALEEKAETFDFGVGDETYKYRFSTDVIQLRNWGLYPFQPEEKKAKYEPRAGH